MKRKPNLLFFGIDSLRRDHMSLYGYRRLTTPHMSEYLKDGVVFENCFSPSIPTTPGYSSMLTGMDCFSTNVVALRHEGAIAEGVKTLPEILRENGYVTSCVGFSGNAGGKGFDKYADYEGWSPRFDGRCSKAENLNAVALPEMERLAKEGKPFMLFLRHMDPHAPYLAPAPFETMFYQGNAFDKDNSSLEDLFNFKPFGSFHKSWFPEGCTDSNYVIAQYDAEVAYMDSCMPAVFEKLRVLGLEEETLVVFTSDHGETLYDHRCYFDHHGLYDCTLNVPFALRYKGNLTGGIRVPDIVQLKDIVPTILDIMGISVDINFDGRDLLPLVTGKTVCPETGFYITEATWMRKHGWRTPQYKFIRALEPDFHYKPEVELYDLIADPDENVNIAPIRKDLVDFFDNKVLCHITKREKEAGRTNPMYTNTNWNGFGRFFASSDEAYNSLFIGGIKHAIKLQDKEKDE